MKKKNTTKKKNGRPPKYTTDEEMCALVDKYLKKHVDEEYRLIKTEGDKSTTWENKIKVNLPTIEGFALWLGVAVSTVHKWKIDYPDGGFSESLEKIKTEQRKRLLEKGLSGDYNSTIAKLILSSNHGMQEKTTLEVELSKKADELLSEFDNEI